MIIHLFLVLQTHKTQLNDNLETQYKWNYQGNGDDSHSRLTVTVSSQEQPLDGADASDNRQVPGSDDPSKAQELDDPASHVRYDRSVVGPCHVLSAVSPNKVPYRP